MAQRRPPDAGRVNAARRALLGAAAVLPACASGPPPADVPAGPLPAPTVRVGDRWRYRLVEQLRGEWLDEPTWEVVETGPELRLTVTGRRDGPPQQERFSQAWSVLEETLYGVSHAYETAVPMVPSGVQSGASARTATSWTEPGAPRRRRWSQQLWARRWESVQVPAGRFDCLRIERVIALEVPDAFRLNSTRTDTLWYAPRVNRWVQRELHGTYVSAGGGRANPPEGEQGIEDRLLWQLTAYLPVAAPR